MFRDFRADWIATFLSNYGSFRAYLSCSSDSIKEGDIRPFVELSCESMGFSVLHLAEVDREFLLSVNIMPCSLICDYLWLIYSFIRALSIGKLLGSNSIPYIASALEHTVFFVASIS